MRGRGLSAALALILASFLLLAAITPTRGQDLALATSLPPPIGTQPAAEIEMITGNADRHDRMTVPVRLGAHGSYDFLVDTGSQRTVLSVELATRLALPTSGRHRVVGIAGSEVTDAALLGEFALGRRSFRDLDVLLFEARHIGADGIVGIDSLQKQRVLMDFVRNVMKVGDAQSLELERRDQGTAEEFDIVVTARRRAGQLIMTDADIDGVRTALVIDTGSSSSVGNRALQRALGRQPIINRFVLVSVTGEEVTADITQANKLSIGKIGITNPLIAYVDGPAFAALGLERKPALMLGMRELRLFRRVAIDFTSRKVFFDLPDGL